MGSGRPHERFNNLRPVTATTSATGSEYTVDEVARITGTTVRTIRWYQSEGLLPSPRRAGRVAVYDSEHVSRLEAIRDLQAHGLTLTAIRRLLDRAPGSAASTALAFVKAAVAQTADHGTEIISAAEGAARLGISADEADVRLIEKMGLARVLDDGRWEIVAPAAFEAAVELAGVGVPLERRVEIAQVLQEHAQAMAQAVVTLFVDYLWRPSALETEDPAAWKALTDMLGRLRPLAATTVASMFDVALAREAEAAAERELTPGAGHHG
jgi:DNA-binding transcriptional MerR regulator